MPSAWAGAFGYAGSALVWDAVGMEVAGLWIAIVAACAALAGAVFTYVQARAATDALADARAARDESARSAAEAHEVLSRIAAAQEQSAAAVTRAAPGQWAALRRTVGSGVALENTTGSAATIESISLVDGSSRARVHFNHRRLPADLDHGDVFEFMVVTGGRQPELEIVWRGPGDDVARRTRRTPPAG